MGLSLLSFKSFLLVLHLSLCFVPAYFKFDSIIDSFIKWAEIDHAEEKEDWLKRKMNKAEEEEEECVKAEKIVNQESSKRGLRITASKPFWFVKYFFMLSLYLELSIWTNFLRSFLCVKDLGSNVFVSFYSPFAYFTSLIDFWKQICLLSIQTICSYLNLFLLNY